MLIQGSCHCGNIKYELQWPGTLADMTVRECDCSFCRKHGGAWTANPSAGLDADIENSNNVSGYRMGTGTAEFYICNICGVVPFATSVIDGHTYAVVNVNSFEGIDLSSLSRSGVTFAGEQVEARLSRRKRNWIPQVNIRGIDQ